MLLLQLEDDCFNVTTSKEAENVEMQEFIWNKSVNYVFAKHVSIKNSDDFCWEEDEWRSCSWRQGGFCNSFFLRGVHPFVCPLVVALERLGHEQLPEVLRGEFLHVLAVVVNLPCWRVATCIHTPPYTNTHTTQKHMYTNAHTHLYKHKHTEEGEEKKRKEKAEQQQISGERSKRMDRNVFRRRGEELKGVKQ